MYVDALECSRFDREVLTELRRGRLDCVTPTLAFWENAEETMDAIGAWHDLARDNSDLVRIARSAADIEHAHEDGVTAVLLGCQNTTPLQDRIRYVGLFWDMGLRVMQLTYNTQNSLGGSCYEPDDSGLSSLGHEFVKEMNQVRMIIDLSHVGERTGLDTIEVSSRPVAVTHANPAALHPHRRNKPDHYLRALAEAGGMLGLAITRNLAGPYAKTVDAWCDLVKHAVDVMGIEHVGIGSDLGRKAQDDARTDWMRQGRWARSPQFGAGSAKHPERVPVTWFRSTESFPSIAEALSRSGFKNDEVDAVLGGNWLRFYRDSFGH